MKIFKWVIGILGASICLIAALTSLVFYFPQIIGHQSVSASLIKSITPTGYHTTWEGADFQLRSASIFAKNATLDFKNFCFVQIKGELELCFKRVHLPLQIKFYAAKLDALTIGEAELSGGRLFYKVTADKDDDEEEKSFAQIVKELETQLNKTLVKSLKVDFEKFEIASAGKIHGGKLSFQLRMPQNKVQLNFTARDLHGPLFSGRKNEVQMELLSSYPQKHGRFPVALKINGAVKLADGHQLNLKIASAPLREELFPLTLNFEGGLLSVTEQARAAGKMILGRNQLTGQLQLQVQTGPPNKSRQSLSLRQCEFSYQYGEFQNFLIASGQIKLKCQMDAKLPVTAEKMKNLQGIIPEMSPDVRANILLSLQMDKKEGSKKKFSGRLQITVLPLKAIAVSAQGRIDVRFHAPLNQLQRGQGIEGLVKLNMQVKDFQTIRLLLQEQQILVPAPFHKLTGPLKMELQGKIPSPGYFLSMPFVVKTDLSSPNQVLKSMLQGEFNLKNLPRGEISHESFKPELNLALFLNEAKFILPQIIPRQNFRPLPDSRIIHSEKLARAAAKKKPSPLNLNFHLSTVQEGSLQLITAISKENIPISLDLRVKDNQFLGGKVAVHSFDVDLFKKNAQLTYFNADLKSKATSGPIDGQLIVRYADYNIKVNVVGTVEKPQLLLESNPPLSEEDITAVLLFGRPLKELTGAEGESVSGLQAAAADGAVTLASLYLLSSTPVESIGYNPETNQMSAKIKIGSKASLTVGSGTSEGISALRSIGIRRRLGQNFVISTEVNTNKESSESDVWTFLEWYNRY